jgi:cytochrome c oxidase assembly protein subunit 15
MRWFSIVTAFGAYLMLLMGAIVSKTGSGKGCGNSWPFCHGQLIPQSLPIETVFEYSHRIISGGVGLMILILTVWCWVRFRQDRRIKLLSFLSLFFVIVQGALGAFTVVFEGAFAKKAALALHFGFSLISFASVVLLALDLFQLEAKKRSRPIVSRGLRWSIWSLAIYAYLVVYTGAYVRHTQSTMGCGYQVPFCGSTWLPDFHTMAGIQLLHRYAAFSLWLLVAVLLFWVWRKYRQEKELLRTAVWAFVWITLQAVSGAATVWAGGQVLFALVHTTIISIFFTVLCYLGLQVGRPWAIYAPPAKITWGKFVETKWK